MARRSLKVAAGLLLLVGLLGLSTALIAEVRDQVVQRSAEADDRPAREVRNRPPGLPAKELTLLDPARGHLPDREPTTGGLQTTGPGKVHLDPGEGLRPGPVTLEAGAQLEVPEAWRVDEGALTCETTCTLTVDGQAMDLPPNATVQPPRGAIGFDPALEPGQRVPLPADTSLDLPPLRFPAGTRLDLRPGAHVDLPENAPSPRTGVDDVRLPAGTVLTRSAAAGSGTDALQRMLDDAEPARDQPPTPQAASQRPSIAITDTPDRIVKGEPFNVTGRVVGPDGEARADHPVTVYANATKHAPGLALHAEPARTDASGTFTARAVLPVEEPTRPYHLLAHAHPRSAATPPLAGAWTDPVVPVEAEARLTLDLPERAGVGVPLPLRADLADAHGAPIPNQTIVFTVEDTDERLTARTGAEGRAHAILPEGLPYTGNYTIHARFPGTGNITPDRDEATIEAITARIQANATHEAPRGEPTTIQGRVVTDEGGREGVRVTARYADLTAANVTVENGRFTLEVPVPADVAPGNHTVQLEARAVDAHHRLILTATAGLRLSTGPLGPQPVGGQAPVPVTVEADNGTRLPGVPIEAYREDRLVDRATSDREGRARLTVPMTQPGDHCVRLEARPSEAYRPHKRVLSLAAAPLTVDGDLGLVPGQATNGTLELSVAEIPLADTPVRLAGPGFAAQGASDAEGQVEFDLQAPAELEPGRVRANLTLPVYDLTLDVPVRVLETPDLVVEIVDQGLDGDPVRLRVEARGSQGGLSGVPIEARTHGAFEARAQAITDADGHANLTLDRPDDAEGSVQIDVLARSTQTTARTAHTASAEVTPAPFPWLPAAAGAAALGLAALAALRHRRRSRAPSEETGPTISLRLAPQTPGDPPVWHPGEPTELVVDARDDAGEPIDATVELEGPDGQRRLDLVHGRARVPVPARSLGTYTYRARLPDRASAETVLDVQIVDEREAIDRAYRQLHRRATQLGLVGPDATPRELAAALGPPADQVARRFERYDYSPRSVDRDDYEAFMALVREADPRG